MNVLFITTVSQIFIISALLMLMLAGVIVFFVLVYQKKMIRQEVAMQRMETEHQRDLLNASIESQEKERQRIAKDMHDEIGAMLSVIKMGIQQFESKVKDQPTTQALATNTREMVVETIDNVRRISKDLMPLALLKLGLPAALKDMFDKLSQLEHIQSVFAVEGTPFSLDEKVALGLYRVMQEALNNCLKHAEASQITCVLRYQPRALLLIFEDNGKGFDLPSLLASKNSAAGLGLKNMESRVNMLGGKLDYSSVPGQGTNIVITLSKTI